MQLGPRFFRSRRESGFTFVELVVVLAILGILIALAVPKFNSLKARGLQAEAKGNLLHLHGLQESYFNAHGRYLPLDRVGASFEDVSTCANTPNELGFSVVPCNEKTRYQYSAIVSEDGSEYTATARSGVGKVNRVIPNCDSPDVWTIDEGRKLTNNSNAISLCP